MHVAMDASQRRVSEGHYKHIDGMEEPSIDVALSQARVDLHDATYKHPKAHYKTLKMRSRKSITPPGGTSPRRQVPQTSISENSLTLFGQPKILTNTALNHYDVLPEKNIHEQGYQPPPRPLGNTRPNQYDIYPEHDDENDYQLAPKK